MDILIFGGPMVALTIGITEAIKRLGIPSKWSPIVAIVIGIIMALISSEFRVSSEVILGGMVMGLSSSGLWSGTKSVLLKKKERSSDN